MIGLVFFTIFGAWLVFQYYKSASLWKAAIAALLGISAIFAVTYLVYASPFFNRFNQMFNYREADSTGLRLYLFVNAIAIWTENLKNFFIGIGHNHYKNINPYNAYSHSTISEVLVSTGVIGFFLYFNSLRLLFKNTYAQTKTWLKTPRFTTVMNCMIFVLIILFFNVTAVLYSERELWPIIGCISSYIMHIKRDADDERPSNYRSS